MIEATRRWFRRNRTNLLVGASVIGAGYFAGQYVLGSISEARQRMRDDKLSKENLRQRFERNQEDCTYTVLALLPTIRDEIIGALPVEQITEQLQQERQERLKRLAASEAPSSEYPSAPPSTIDDASTASFIHTSQMGMSSLEDPSKPKRSKAQLWQDMKINSIARALALLYTLSFLTILTRIQLNLLGRRTYLSSVVSMASPPPDMNASTISLEDRDDSNLDNAYGNDFETNRMYLTFSWWVLHRGAKQVLERVMAAVKEVFGQVNIREDMTLERLSILIIEVRRRVEGATEQERRQQSWLEYLLPPRDEEIFVINQANHPDSSDASPEPGPNPLDVQTITPSLRRLLDETADLIDSPTFSLVLGRLLDTGFSHLVDVRIAAEAFKASIPQDGARLTEITDNKCKLAHILPVFCRQAHTIVAGSGELDAIAGVAPTDQMTNEYLQLLDRVHDLEAFAAVIYSSNFEYEVADSPRTSARLPQSVISAADSPPLDEKISLPQLSASVPESVSQAANSVSKTVGDAIQQAQSAVPEAISQAQTTVQRSAESLQEKVSQAQSTVQQSMSSPPAPVSQAKTTIQHSANSIAETASQATSTIQQSVISLPETVSQARSTLQQSVISLPDTEVLDEKIDPVEQTIEDVPSSSQSVDPLTDSAVAVETQDVPAVEQDFESAWTKAIGSGELQESQTVAVPGVQTATESSTQSIGGSTVVVPTMEAASEITPAVPAPMPTARSTPQSSTPASNATTSIPRKPVPMQQSSTPVGASASQQTFAAVDAPAATRQATSTPGEVPVDLRRQRDAQA